MDNCSNMIKYRLVTVNGVAKEVEKANTNRGKEKEDKGSLVLNNERTNWGRAWTADFWSLCGCILTLVMCPFLPLVMYFSCSQYECSLSDTFLGFYKELPISGIRALFLSLSIGTVKIYAAWILFQIFLNFLPDVLHYLIPLYTGGIRKGSVTPAGYVNDYQINGLQAWVITHTLWLLNAFHFQYFSPSIIARNVGEFIILANIAGYFLSVFMFVKGHLFPTHKEDCKFSGNFLYDVMMGVEFNPRIGKHFDFKLFFNGRPGIICWTLINFSYAWHQWEKFGYITDSMALVNILHGIYVVDFFWNESWYLKTIDICHDHFGWYLAWGDLVWLPIMYTLQAFYLSHNPVHLGSIKFLGILLMGILSYIVFRSANRQKDRFRMNPSKCVIWGKKASYINCTYFSSDGKQHKSNLLTSGWWGVGRHINYTGDLLGSLSYCLCCGTEHILPYFYIIFLFILLVHRIYRDEHRCLAKYGKHWEEYTKIVPYRLIPGVY